MYIKVPVKSVQSRFGLAVLDTKKRFQLVKIYLYGGPFVTDLTFKSRKSGFGKSTYDPRVGKECPRFNIGTWYVPV